MESSCALIAPLLSTATASSIPMISTTMVTNSDTASTTTADLLVVLKSSESTPATLNPATTDTDIAPLKSKLLPIPSLSSSSSSAAAAALNQCQSKYDIIGADPQPIKTKRWKKPAIKKSRRFGFAIPVNVGCYPSSDDDDDDDYEQEHDDNDEDDNGGDNGYDAKHGRQTPSRQIHDINSSSTIDKTNVASPFTALAPSQHYGTCGADTLGKAKPISPKANTAKKKDKGKDITISLCTSAIDGSHRFVLRCKLCSCTIVEPRLEKALDNSTSHSATRMLCLRRMQTSLSADESSIVHDKNADLATSQSIEIEEEGEEFSYASKDKVKEAKKEAKKEKERIYLRVKKWRDERRTRAVTKGKTATSSAVEKHKTAKGGRKRSGAATPKKKVAAVSRKSRRATLEVETIVHDQKEEEEIIKPSVERRRITKQPISYAEPALNSKLRRGDEFFP
eukprot:scaffold845_cov274-Chaetoceros_neogracile.AAC.40